VEAERAGGVLGVTLPVAAGPCTRHVVAGFPFDAGNPDLAVTTQGGHDTALLDGS
jgi:hypothetical protein